MDDNDVMDDFGANDWLIEEMLEKYTDNPRSVSLEWADFFDTNVDASSVGQNAGGGDSSGTKASNSQQPAEQPSKPSIDASATPGAAQREPLQKDDQPGNEGAPESPQPGGTSALRASGKSEPGGQEPALPTEGARDTGTSPASPGRRDRRREKPRTPGTGGGLSADAPRLTIPEVEIVEPTRTVLRGAPMRTAKNMEASLAVPTATSVRSIPMKLVIDQRILINNFLRRRQGGKVTFTHLLGFAMVRALQSMPEMNKSFETNGDGKPVLVTHQNINLGLAVDVAGKDGSRTLLVPNIKGCEQLNFAQFWAAYDDVVSRALKGKLTIDDFHSTTASLTNPGGIGTNHSVPRLMAGQGVILGVGSINYPPEYAGTSEHKLDDMAVGKITTLTSTYDHRVIQGAASGEFLKRMQDLLLGADGFWESVFESLRIPFAPLRWAADVSAHRASQVSKSARVLELIQAYRAVGHLIADTDPLEYRQRNHSDTQLETHGLTVWDLDREFAVGVLGDSQRAFLSLREILDTLLETYCHTLGVEYMHINDPKQRNWFQQRLEGPHTPLPKSEHIRILDKLNEAEIFETFLQTKFVGQKRFSLEGSESTIVFLDELCELAADNNLDEVCIGMPHRGRLNVLANIIGKKYSQIFREFEGNADPRSQGSGDVKYHLGAEGEFVAASGATIKASVAANPSHLEAVNPVLEGIARGKLDAIGRIDRFDVLPILMHGDASFAGQGVVYEVLQMSQLNGYRTGGTIHVVVNNQVGFTTSPNELRSSVYCTDVAKTIQAPILHVNGDDADACIRAARIAFEYREKFNKDVVIDIVSYRRRGHNEGDDPSFTQPHMYDLIEQKRSTRRIYTEALIGRGDITLEDAEGVMNRFRSRLEGVFTEVRNPDAAQDEEYSTAPYYPIKPDESMGTNITRQMLETMARVHTEMPDGFAVHPKVMPQLQRRAKSILEGPIDWATAELLAIGSLLMEGRPVRMSGQDSRRGTFSQRFAAVVDRRTSQPYVPLKHLTPDQAPFYIYDSLLSEYGAMGFEYGYSVARPEALVLWEAQFGDFANGAQIIADEFFSSGFAKWGQKSGVVLLLPHGYEGQGPDHSSSRIERWLHMCSEGAFAVCQPSTPASHFHLLRTHAYVNWHRPVVIATPKSMLRNKLATSSPDEFINGAWLPARGDDSITEPRKVKRVLLCSGKIRWELVAMREKLGLNEKVAIVALERLYPLPTRELAVELDRYATDDIRFVQEEPENMGAWRHLALHLPKAIRQENGRTITLRPFTRDTASAPSVGSHQVHVQQQDALLNAALTEH